MTSAELLTNTMKKILTLLTVIVLLSACTSPQSIRPTLNMLDINTEHKADKSRHSTAKSESDIRKAYATYLKHASKSDKSRANALNRLAALEFKLSEQILKNRDDNNGGAVETAEDNLYNAKLKNSIELLSTALHDYPDGENNDQTLYQLAKAYDQSGDIEKSHIALAQLSEKHPKSIYYVESQFRLAEYAFSLKKYSLAEDRYTEVIGSKKNNLFYEKSLYKRGWSRFKQEFYFEAMSDFLHVVELNQFNEFHSLSDIKKDLFNEYFRAIGLSFSYMGGAETLQYYFKNNPDFEHLYDAYSHLSRQYIREERTNDAITTLQLFAKQNAHSDYVPEALLRVIDLLKSGGFPIRMNTALETFYTRYHPGSDYWEKREKLDQRIFKLVKNSLREYVLTITANYHKEYLQRREASDYANARRWYKNYLEHYSSYSKKDNIHYLYASLLAENKKHTEALKHYELAAFDSGTIINKDAAYDAILLASKLSASASTHTWIHKLIHFSTLFGGQYPNDKQTANIILNASERAYNSGLYKETILLSELITNSAQQVMLNKINTIKAHAYFKLKQFADAESTYLNLLNNDHFAQQRDSSLADSLALAIYYQGKSAYEKNDVAAAIQHYMRIAQITPHSAIAATGIYDAILLATQNELWNQSIHAIKIFQRLYPHHKDAHNVSKRLTEAYLNSNQDIKAAKELEKLANNQQDRAYRLAALWKAGEIYKSNKEYTSAIRSFEKYAKLFHRPFPQYMESMFKLVTLHTLNRNADKANRWHKTILQADKKASPSLGTERTRYIASSAALYLARESHAAFTQAKLIRPLKQNLINKKDAMQKAVNLYGRASSYKVAETATEATHAIADIYNQFSISLLNSERPKKLNEDELEQYEILLEDQAFPFEEKAIEFYEINLAYVKDDIYDKWIDKSHRQLKKLFPVRYQREEKLDGYVNVLH